MKWRKRKPSVPLKQLALLALQQRRLRELEERLRELEDLIACVERMPPVPLTRWERAKRALKLPFIRLSALFNRALLFLSRT